MTINPVPDLIVGSIHDVTPDVLEQRGIKGLLVDLDNTLACYNESEPSEDVIDWVRTINDSGVKISIISNNSQERVDQFNKKLGLEYNVGRAHKPFKRVFLQVAKTMGLDVDKVAVLGDQIYTDVLGGKGAKMYTIMILSKDRTWNALLALRRALEMPFIKAYERRRRHGKAA